MKLILYTGLIFLMNFVYADTQAPTNWRLVQEENNVQVWRLRSPDYITVTKESRQNKKPLDLKKLKNTKFFEDFTSRKKKMLKLIGVSQWKIENHAWQKKDAYQVLHIEGSYRAADSSKVYFKETHYFSKNKTIQLLESTPTQSKQVNKEFSLIADYLKGQTKW